MALDGVAHVNGHELTADNMVVLDTGLNEIEIEVKKGNRVLLIGGEPLKLRSYYGGISLHVRWTI